MSEFYSPSLNWVRKSGVLRRLLPDDTLVVAAENPTNRERQLRLMANLMGMKLFTIRREDSVVARVNRLRGYEQHER